jgi:hypothetical protein
MKTRYTYTFVATPLLIFLIIGIIYLQNQNAGSLYPAIEQIEFQDGSIDLVSVAKMDGNFIIHLGMKNTGVTATSVNSSMILYNGKLSNATEYIGYEPIPDFEMITLKAGEQKNQQIVLVGGPSSPWQSGAMVQIKLETVKGNQFIKIVTLP